MYFVIFLKLRKGLQFWRIKKDVCPSDGEIFFSHLQQEMRVQTSVFKRIMQPDLNNETRESIPGAAEGF